MHHLCKHKSGIHLCIILGRSNYIGKHGHFITASGMEAYVRKEVDTRMVEAIKKLNNAFLFLIKIVLIIFGTVMTVLVITNVILRYVFNSGLTWSEEASRFLFIWTTFLGAILGESMGAHMRLDFIVDAFPGVSRKVVQVIALLVVLFLSCMLVYGGYEVVTVTWKMPTSALKIPKGSVYLGAPICFGYFVLSTIARIITTIKEPDDRKNRKEE